MAADIPSSLASWSTTESSNAPSGATLIGTNLDDNLRMIQAVVAGISNGTQALTTPALGTPASGALTNCTFPTLNQNTTGSAAKWTTARNLAGNSVDGSANVAFANKFIVQGTADTGLSGAQFLGALGTGIVKNTTTTGVMSIAVAGDFPTLNQNTTGSAATLTTPRAIYGNNFDGSAALTQAISAAYGGTGVANNAASTWTISGNYATTVTVTGTTSVTFPTTGTLVTLAGTETLTNKRVTARVSTTASSATPTPNADTTDEYTVTALAAGATFGAPTGTPTEGQKLIIRIKDNGGAQTLAWNAIYRASSDLALPTTTVISKTLYCGFVYNATDSKWDLLALLNNF